jgi:hypothetical protein
MYMNFHQGITIDYLNQIHGELSREQQSLIEEMKQTQSIEKEKVITKQIGYLNQLLLQILRFRNVKRQIQVEAQY